MSERQVIRQDIVQIEFDVRENPMEALIKSMEDFTKSVKKMQSANDGLEDIKKNADKSKSSLQGMADKANAIKSKLQPALTKVDNGLTAIGKSAVAAGKKITSGMATAAKTAGKVAGLGVTAFAGLTGAAVNAYAEYEQLVGGVETLFGAGGLSLSDYAASEKKTVDQVKSEYDKLMTSQNTVIKNANDAYKTAGLDANAYMETVTSFSAALIKSVGGDTVKASGLANQAIIDMSDNANKMGTDMESIQYAYQGFAKQNYTIKSSSLAA